MYYITREMGQMKETLRFLPTWIFCFKTVVAVVWQMCSDTILKQFRGNILNFSHHSAFLVGPTSQLPSSTISLIPTLGYSAV
jgi:hypothetical protein